ncbi:MAG TPA: glycosyltransferase family 4 protein [Methylophilaceae bacterium]
MKFAFLIFKYFPFGGVQRDMLRIARDCAAKGHEVTIYTGKWQGDKPEGNIKVVCLPSKGWLNHRRYTSLISAMQQQIKLNPPDLLVGFNRMPGLDAYFAADPCFIERAHSERGYWYRFTGRYRFFADTERAVAGEDSQCKILLLSPPEKAAFQRWYHTPESRFYLLPPNIPTERFANLDRMAAHQQLRQEFGLPKDAKVLLMVGSAFIRKGLDRAIEALAALPENIRSNCWLLAVGEDKAEKMHALAGKLGVASRVIITKGRSDIPQLMAGADVLLHPARSELAGIVIIEAMTAGLPVIVTENCGYAMHISAAGAGRVLPVPYQQSDLNLALVDALQLPDLEKWAKAGRQYTAQIAASTSATVEVDLLETFAAEKSAKHV